LFLCVLVVLFSIEYVEPSILHISSTGVEKTGLPNEIEPEIRITDLKNNFFFKKFASAQRHYSLKR